MPRKQLEILKDLFIAHRDKDQALYQEKAREFVRYLRWKGHHKKADEFEEIVQLINNEIQQSSSKPEQVTLFGVEPQKEIPKKKKNSKTTWQVARGAEINFVQIQRLLEAFFDSNKSSYSTKELENILGYSKKKAQGFGRLLYFLGLLEDKSRKPTKLATLIHQYDAYFEDIGTLWFLHYYISSQTNLIIWNRITNRLMTKPSFSYQEAAALFEDQRATHTEYSFNHHLRKEFNIFTRAYLESEFSKLNLIISENKDEFVKTTPTSAPDEVLLAAILLFKHRVYPEEVTIEVKSLVHPENSPGRLFYLNEYKFREALERLRIVGAIFIESFANLDQIKFIDTKDYLECLEMYYRNKFGG